VGRRLSTRTVPEHDYALEPPDEIIAELQSSVVQSRRGAVRTRQQLLRELGEAVREFTSRGDAESAVHVAAIAIRLRMAASLSDSARSA
jgi:hypothetical protein